MRVGSVREPGSAASIDITTIKHPVLSLYYSCVVTLRTYLLAKLPVSSKARRRRLLAIGNCPQSRQLGHKPSDLRRNYATSVDDCSDGSTDPNAALAGLLDTTLVGGLETSDSAPDQTRMSDLATFSQQQSKSTAASSAGSAGCSQSEVRPKLPVDMVLSLRFLFDVPHLSTSMISVTTFLLLKGISLGT